MKLNIFKKELKAKKATETEKVEIKKTKEPTVIKTGAPQSDFAYHILTSPYLTEKTTALQNGNQYVFKVAPRANKIAVRQAVEKLYGVKVEKVRMITVPAKQRKLGRWEGEKSGFKKAIVKVTQGQKIDVGGAK